MTTDLEALVAQAPQEELRIQGGCVAMRRGVWVMDVRLNGRRIVKTYPGRGEALDALAKLRLAAQPSAGPDPLSLAALAELGQRMSGEGFFELAGRSVRRLRYPVVYVWMRGDRVLYVGKGATVARPLDPRHHRLSDIRPTDRLRVWPIKNRQEATRLEAAFIQTLQPELNGKPEDEYAW